jgi:predicted AAA+ superfamily ATPase
MIDRKLGNKIIQFSQQYPCVLITGPRQSGKTTLCKMLFPNRYYVSLEDPEKRQFAIQDPKSFLQVASQGMIIDEIQRVPDLLSYIQIIVDESGNNGQFILTGSQQFEIMAKVSQSLAGRVAICRLLPFSFTEIAHLIAEKTLDDILYTGFYPRIYDKQLNPTEALSFYSNTYLERDVRQLINISDLNRFEIFLRLCAGRTGQLLNLNTLGNECGVSHNTIKSWITVLQASYIVKLVYPYYKNLNKRIVKTPKLYFLDVGLACYLLNINDAQQIQSHPLRGALFETLIVSDIIKEHFHQSKPDNVYFLRDQQGNEVDLVLERGNELDLLEIKSSQTIASDFFKGIDYYAKLYQGISHRYIIYGGNESRVQQNTRILGWKNIAEFFQYN